MIFLSFHLFRLESTSVAELSHWDQKIAAAKDQLAKVSQVNTQLLERVADLTEQQYSLEDQLNTTTKNVHVRAIPVCSCV
jgi:hypothetical protein